MKAYLVGGAVRDRLFDLPVKDRDWVVVGATAEQMLAAGYRPVESDFPVFRHPQSGEEYALARRERKTGAGYRGFETYTGMDVTLEDDLVRRDLTINAMAQEEDGRLIDPFHGREDLEQGLLRHVSPAFTEDPVRLLRTARFAARFGHWGFRVAHTTQQLLRRMAAADDLRTLNPERVWREMRSALEELQPWRFFEVLQRCGALAVLIPELDAVMEPGAGHGMGEDSEPITSLQRAAACSADPTVRFAVVMHDAVRQTDADAFVRRLRAERPFADLLLLLVRLGDAYRRLDRQDPAGVVDLLEHSRALQHPDRFARLVTACESLWPAEGVGRALLERSAACVGTVSAEDLQREGLSGEALAEALRKRRLKQVGRLLQEV